MWGKALSWASATQESLQQSKCGEKLQLWPVACKRALHCWGSEPNPHPRLGPSACSDEAESRYFSSPEREHYENMGDGNPSCCFRVTSLGDRRKPYSPRQGRWSSLLLASSSSFSAPLCTQVLSTALVQRHPAVPCSCPSPARAAMQLPSFPLPVRELPHRLVMRLLLLSPAALGK